MLVDLVQTTTRDGVRLDGAYQAPAVAGSAGLAVDAFCLLHGAGANFYNSSLLAELAEHLRNLGCGVLRVNTRGHDAISTAQTSRGGRRQGQAFEVVDDCRHDVAAWMDWLKERAGPRIGLIGHSLGAIKAPYALVHAPAPPAACVIALSPPRLAYSWFCASPQRDEFLQIYERAERHIREGRPTELMEVSFPGPFITTAGAYAEKYGPDERYDYLKFVASVPCPLLVTFGSLEVESQTPFRGAPETLAELAARHGRLRVEVIGDADHVYTGRRQELIGRIEAWLRAAL